MSCTDDDGKDAQARHGIQQDAHGAEGPLGHRDAVGALGKKHQCGHSQRRRNHPAAQTGRDFSFYFPLFKLLSIKISMSPSSTFDTLLVSAFVL